MAMLRSFMTVPEKSGGPSRNRAGRLLQRNIRMIVAGARKTQVRRLIFPNARRSRPSMSRIKIASRTLGPGEAAAFGAMLVALGPISMALYTPAMPELVAAFDTSLAAVKTTLTAYFAGFALAQLVCGPLSDGYGRRPVLIGFLAIYTAASAAAALAPTIELMTLARLIQGTGAAAGVAISRAIVRDGFTGQPAARIMNTIGIWLALGPALSPILGAVLLVTAGWPAIFAAMVVYGVALLGIVAFRLPETNALRDPVRASPKGLMRAYRRLALDIRFMLPAAILGLTIGSLYANATMLPFVMIERAGLSPTDYGFAMMIQSGSFNLGGLVAPRMLGRIDATRLVLPGLALCALGGVMLSISLAIWPPSVPSVMGPIGVFAFALALVMPALTTGALAPFAAEAGAASALMGFFQMSGGVLGSAAASLIGDPVIALAVVVPSMTVVGLAAGLLAKARGTLTPA
jgi:DHA1 family bicyclomycin/chloramphenicol resistance-like MFS transporter